MPRPLPEWIGKNSITPVPPRVKLRVLHRHAYRCAGCRRGFVRGEIPFFDHTVAIINGGENREGNIQPLCSWCHVDKTRDDVAQKREDARKRRKRYGIAVKRWRPLLGTIASGWKRKFNGIWERR